ncbi:MAG: PilZ domain-containing protein [Proteobacteria bacterium]|nr:PilZ domain-containing protein [Pseudomonadota bacterium]
MVKGKRDMRNYIRHPSDIPLEIVTETLQDRSPQTMKDVSLGGLSFFSEQAHNIWDIIKVSIPYVKPAFVSEGQVTWCIKQGDRYEVGVEFFTADDDSRARIVKQVFYIEDFIKEVKKPGRGRDDIELAAREWIKRHVVDSLENEPDLFTSKISPKKGSDLNNSDQLL